MNLHVINTGFFKLDGGAMFGVVPKSIWQKLNPPDEKNLCTWAMRCLLIEDQGKLVLIDNGIGGKQDAKFLRHYELHGNDTLSSSLRALQLSENDITDMFLTHLHFDHCGGGVRYEGTDLVLTFKNATYWSNAEHWKWATQPNAREKASFLKENILPMQERGQLQFVDVTKASPLSQFEIQYFSGHTDHLMMPMIPYKGKAVCFVSDLLPSVGHIPLPYLMSYDTRPLITLKEKEKFLGEAADREYILFLEHDPTHECCTVKRSEKGIVLDRTFSLRDI